MKKKQTFWRTVLVLSLIGIIACLGFAIWYLYQENAAREGYEQVQETATETEAESETKLTREDIENAEFTGEVDGEAAKLPEGIFLDMENPIDFKALQEINPDLYAWIRIPETNIDYPIAQREGDNGYYLTHDMYGEYRFAGCIYTEDANSKDFSDPNTVIYGHNMKNTTMFQNLHLFADGDFFDKHPLVYIYTPGHVRAYEIFAAYTYDDRHILNSFDFTDREIYEGYLDEILHVRAMDANIREDVSVTADDRILTLSTCVGGQTSSRYLVQAVLIKDEK